MNVFDDEYQDATHNFFGKIRGKNMKFYKPHRIPDFAPLAKLLSPTTFLKDCLERGTIDEITGKYYEDVYHLCHNACAWSLLQLRDTIFFEEVKVLYGKFEWGEHSWLQIGDYYIDLTLAQFNPLAPCLAICKAENGLLCGYKPSSIMDAHEWILQEASVLCD